MKPYDIVALVPIIEGAGGVVTTWDGGGAAAGGRIIAAGDRASTRRRAACCSRGRDRRTDGCNPGASSIPNRPQAKPRKTKAIPSKKAWSCLVLFVRIGPFQWVTAKKIKNPFSRPLYNPGGSRPAPPPIGAVRGNDRRREFLISQDRNRSF